MAGRGGRAGSDSSGLDYIQHFVLFFSLSSVLQLHPLRIAANSEASGDYKRLAWFFQTKFFLHNFSGFCLF